MSEVSEREYSPEELFAFSDQYEFVSKQLWEAARVLKNGNSPSMKIGAEKVFGPYLEEANAMAKMIVMRAAFKAKK